MDATDASTGDSLISVLRFVFSGNTTLIGMTAPKVIWLGAGVLVLFTCYHAIKLFAATHQLIKGLRYHEKLVAESIKNHPKLTGSLLDELDRELASSNLLSHSWSEFRETLLAEDFGGEKLIFNTRAANEFFSKEDVLESNLKLAWYHAVPGVLTGAGLMFTFLAILVGLHGLVEPGSPEISQSGMIHLVESLSGKFLTSVCALGLATLFVLLEKRLTNKAERAYKRFVRTLDARFPRRSSEHLLERIASAASEQSTQLRHFGADLSGRLKEGMTESFQPILERLALAIDKLEREKSETL